MSVSPFSFHYAKLGNHPSQCFKFPSTSTIIQLHNNHFDYYQSERTFQELINEASPSLKVMEKIYTSILFLCDGWQIKIIILTRKLLMIFHVEVWCTDYLKNRVLLFYISSGLGEVGQEYNWIREISGRRRNLRMARWNALKGIEDSAIVKTHA